MPVLLQRTERWQFVLSAVEGRQNAKITYTVQDKDNLEDQCVGRVSRGYWRPLSKELRIPSSKRNTSLIMPVPPPSATQVAAHDAAAVEEPNVKKSAQAQPCVHPHCCTKRSRAGSDKTPKQGRRKRARAYEHEHTSMHGASALRSLSAGRVLATSPGRDLLRQQAHAKLEKQAERMRKRAAKKQMDGAPIVVGCIVRLRLEDVDRAKLDNCNATLVVLDVTAKQNYTVGNRAGIFQEKVYRSYLTPVPDATPEMVGLDQLLSDYQDDLLRDEIPRVGIRKIAAADSLAGGQGMLHCSCMGKCNNNRCSCFKAGRLCTSRCHRSNRLCENHQHG